MRQVVMTRPGEIVVEDRADPVIIEPTDAVIRLAATCVCGSDLRPYRGVQEVDTGIHLAGGPAPVRRYLPELIDLIRRREIDPGKVFDLTLPLDRAAEGYRAMDERRAIKVLLTV